MAVNTKFLFLNALANGSTTAQLESNVFNMAKLMNSANRTSEYRNVDNAGNAQMYTIGMKVTATKAHGLVYTAPHTYVTKNAVKEWHDARVKMYKRAGVSMKDLGYGRQLRPYLDVDHENGTVVEIDTEDSASLGITPPFTGDEWTYSRAAVSTPAEAGSDTSSVQVRDLTDTYSFTLCGDSITEDGTADDPDQSSDDFDQDSFVSVGMLKEWLRSFRPKANASSTNESIDDDNALLQLMYDGPSSEEVLELAQEGQTEGRPWDLRGSTHYSLAYAGLCRAVGESSYIVFQAPCGLFRLTLQSEAAAETIFTEFDVLDVRDM